MENFIKSIGYKKKTNEDFLNDLNLVGNNVSENDEELIHLHSTRNGPPVANDIFLIKNEFEKNNNIKKIIGIYQPYTPVLKTINYWMSGLNSGDLNNVLNKIEFENGKLFDENFQLNSNIAFSLSDDLYIDKVLLIELFFLPLIKYIKQAGFYILENDFIDFFLKNIMNDCLDGKVKFSVGINKLGESLINYLLKPLEYPKFELIEPINYYKNFISHSSDIENWKSLSKSIFEKNIKLLTSTKDQIQKHFKKHKRITKESVSRGLNMLSEKQGHDSYFNQLNILSNIFKDHYDEETGVYNFESLEEIYDLIDTYSMSFMFFSNIKGYDKSKKTIDSIVTPTKQNILHYISGESMIDLVFEYANKNNLSIILQRFLRDGDGAYKKYIENINRFPSVATRFSSVDIWNSNQFDMFDKNLVFALCHIK